MTQIHPTATIDAGAEIGEGTLIWHYSHVRESARIGKNCVIGEHVYIGPNVVIGDGVKIQNNVSVYEGVTIEDDVFVGPGVVFTNVINPRAFIERKSEFRPTLIRKGATLGANSTILCGLTIGQFALIAAAAVITDDVVAHALMIGSPAIRKGWVSKCGHTLKAHGQSGYATCEMSGDEYAIEEDNCMLIRKKEVRQ